MSFNGLGLSPELLRAVADQGYETPTPVQSAAIPLVLEGRDLLAGAQTGTGKTAAFVLPIIHRLHETRRDAGAARHQVRVLVVVPTRELAIQVEESVRTYGAHRPIRSATVYGGVGFGPQVSRLRAGPEIVVATPGRLLDHLGQGTINLSSVEVLVLDEADRMLDMGFIRDIRKILAVLPPKRQNLLFSATFSDDISQLADGLLTNPAHVQVTPRNTTDRADRPARDPGGPRAQARPAARARRPGTGLSRRWSSRGRSTARTGSRSSCAGTASRRPPSTATAASPSA